MPLPHAVNNSADEALPREVLQFPLELVDGTFAPPPMDVPGLGVEVSDDLLRRHPFVPGSGERG